MGHQPWPPPAPHRSLNEALLSGQRLPGTMAPLSRQDLLPSFLLGLSILLRAEQWESLQPLGDLFLSPMHLLMHTPKRIRLSRWQGWGCPEPGWEPAGGEGLHPPAHVSPCTPRRHLPAPKNPGVPRRFVLQTLVAGFCECFPSPGPRVSSSILLRAGEEVGEVCVQRC